VLKFNQRTNGLPVAPGLSAIATITYLAKDDIEIKEELIVTVDGHAVRVPIYALVRSVLIVLASVAVAGAISSHSDVGITDDVITLLLKFCYSIVICDVD
jgi:hypothetical protein